MSGPAYRRSLRIPALKLGIDAVAVFLAVVAAYWLRFHSPLTELIPVTKGFPPFHTYLAFAAFLVVVMTGLFSVFRTYRSRFFSNFSQDLGVIFRVCFLGILFAMSGAFLYREVSYSRVVFALIFFNLNIFLTVGRYLFHKVKDRLMERSGLALRLVLVGSETNLARVYRQISQRRDAPFRLVGYVAESSAAEVPLPHMGGFDALDGLMERGEGIDGFILSFDHRDHPRVLDVMRAGEGRNMELFYVPDILDILTTRFHSLEVNGVPLIQLKAALLSGWQGLLKRSFDVAVSGTALLLLAPLFALLAVLVRLSSPGPVFYRQPRVGLDGREFDMIKFRSMRTDAEKGTGPVWSVPGDPRTTPVGRLLRRTSLDELPQLWNVFKGEMSLVGPRPERKHFVDRFQGYIPKYVERHRVRSGMTGWAQVNGLRGQSSIEERTQYDLYYIENWSLWFDLKIIFMTLLEVVRGENAY